MAERRGRTFRNVRGDTVDGLQPVGGSDVSRLIGGLDGVLNSTTAAAREIHNAAREMRIVNERLLTMGTGAGQEGTDATGGLTRRDLTEAFNSAIREQTNALLQTLPGNAPPSPPPHAPTAPAGVPDWARNSLGNPYQYAPGQAPPRVPPGTPGGWIPSPASAGGVPPVEQVNGPLSEPTPGAQESPWDIYERTKGYFGSGNQMSMANLRRDLGSRMQQTLGNATWGEQLVQDPNGAWHHPSQVAGELGDYADEATVAAFMRRRQIMGALRGAGQTLAEGGTMRQAGMGMLGGTAAKALGVVGAGIYAADKVLDFAENQRRENADWQRIQGGSNFGAFEERGRSRLFGLTQRGVLGGDEAAMLYRSVAETGMDRDQRTQAQQFAVDNYKYMGMSIEQSMQVVKTAADTGQESLLGLSDALRDVTDSAAKAGVNTDVARQQFIQTWQTFSDVLTGPAAVTTASAFTQGQMGLGRRYADMDFSGVTAVDQMRMMGARRGMSYNEVLAETMGAGGQTRLSEMWTQDAQRLGAMQMGPVGQQIIADAWANRQNTGKGEGMTDAELQRTTVDLLRNNPNMDVPTLIQVMEQVTGIQGLDPNDALGYMVKLQTGEFDPAREARKAERAGRTRRIDTSVDRSEQAAGSFNPLNHLNPFGGDEIRNAGLSKEWVALREEVESKRSGWRWSDRDARGVSKAYLESVENTGRAGGISQKLATTDDNGLDIAKKVEVQTADGPRIVSLEEAMQHFRDQIDAGTATIVEGSKAGVTMSEAVGMVGDKRLKGRLDRGKGSAGRKDLGGIGESVEEAGGSRGGTVTISPSPELRRYFRFGGTGNVDLTESWSTGPHHVTPNGLPTGNP